MIFLFIIIYFLKLRQYFQVGILNKFNKYSGDNLLTGRTYIWGKVIQDVSILGNGPTYFSDAIGKGAHNSILHVTAVFGIFAGLFISLFYLASVFASLNYSLHRHTQYSNVPLTVVVAFFLLSMAESMFGIIGKSITLVFFNIIGVLIFC